ncbi:MAG: hypothetical protein V4556_08880 [Bacteroidota bacterium]
MENTDETYTLRYQQNTKIAMVLILVPVIGVLLILLPLGLITIDLPDWLVFGLIMIGIISVVAFTIYLVMKKTIVDCCVRLTKDGFEYELTESSFLYRRKKFFSSWENISNISDNLDTKNDLTFYQVSFISPDFTASFNYKPGYENDVLTFWNHLLYYKNEFNLQHKNNKQIGNKGFYDTRAAWILTQVTYLALLGILYIKLVYPDMLNWWRAIGFMAFALVWLGNYHTNRKRKKQA